MSNTCDQPNAITTFIAVVEELQCKRKMTYAKRTVIGILDDDVNVQIVH